MRPRHEPLLAWPGWGLVRFFLLLGTAVALWWCLVYHGADWLTCLRPRRVRVHCEAELAMPFVPAFILAYLSLNLVFLPAPLILRSRRELRALALALAAVTAVAGIGFLLVPAEPAYAAQDPGAWTGLFRLARGLALRHNLVPSLHVAMSCLCLDAYATRFGPTGRMVLGTWAAAIATATLLTHQHHLLDVATGLLLSAAGKRLIFDRWRRRHAVARTVPATSSAGPVSVA